MWPVSRADLEKSAVLKIMMQESGAAQAAANIPPSGLKLRAWTLVLTIRVRMHVPDVTHHILIPEFEFELRSAIPPAIKPE